jgi:hypothetical protein
LGFLGLADKILVDELGKVSISSSIGSLGADSTLESVCRLPPVCALCRSPG